MFGSILCYKYQALSNSTNTTLYASNIDGRSSCGVSAVSKEIRLSREAFLNLKSIRQLINCSLFLREPWKFEGVQKMQNKDDLNHEYFYIWCIEQELR